MGGGGAGRADRSCARLGRSGRWGIEPGRRRDHLGRRAGRSAAASPARTTCAGRSGPEDVQIAGPPDAASADEAMRAASARGRWHLGATPQETRSGRPGRAAGHRVCTGGARRSPHGRESPPRTRQPNSRRDAAWSACDRTDRRAGAETRGPEASALHRWLLVVVPLLVIATIAWRYRRHRMAGIPTDRRKRQDRGDPGPGRGEFRQGLPASLRRQVGRRCAGRGRRGCRRDPERRRRSRDLRRPALRRLWRTCWPRQAEPIR